MKHEEFVAYMSTAKRVTVGTITQVTDNSLVTSFVPKIRGRMVCHDMTVYKYPTREEAHKAGWEILNKWRADYEKSAQPMPPQKEGE